VPSKKTADAISELADLIPYGHLQASTAPDAFIAEVAQEIRHLRACLHSALARVEIANREGDDILSAWAEDARALLRRATP